MFNVSVSLRTPLLFFRILRFPQFKSTSFKGLSFAHKSRYRSAPKNLFSITIITFFYTRKCTNYLFVIFREYMIFDRFWDKIKEDFSWKSFFIAFHIKLLKRQTGLESVQTTWFEAFWFHSWNPTENSDPRLELKVAG